jgi:hypothetical protein
MVLRESADYHGEFSRDGAQACVESAKSLFSVVDKLVEN